MTKYRIKHIIYKSGYSDYIIQQRYLGFLWWIDDYHVFNTLVRAKKFLDGAMEDSVNYYYSSDKPVANIFFTDDELNEMKAAIASRELENHKKMDLESEKCLQSMTGTASPGTPTSKSISGSDLYYTFKDARELDKSIMEKLDKIEDGKI